MLSIYTSRCSNAYHKWWHATERKWKYILLKLKSTWYISRHVKCGRGTESFGGGCSDGELVGDTRVELGEQMMGGVGGQRHRESGSLERHRRVERAQTAVADLWSGGHRNLRFTFCSTELHTSLFSSTTTNSTSYCMMIPLGSDGSFQYRRILSSNGVALTDWLGTAPGTINTHTLCY